MTALLVPDYGAQSVLLSVATRIANSQDGELRAKQACGHIPLDDGDSRGSLASKCHKVASLVDLERSGIPGVGIGCFDPLDSTRRSVDRVRRRRVLLGSKGLVVSVDGIYEVPGDVDLGGLGQIRRPLPFWIGRERLRLVERETAARVRNLPGSHRIAKLVHRI